MNAIIAACHSRACAPPPVGRGGSDTRGRKFDKAIRSTSPTIRQAAEKALAESIYRGDTKIYHGSRHDIAVGDIVRPSDSAGREWHSPGPKAFATRNIPTTAIYGKPTGWPGVDTPGQTLKIYEVEPVKRDLEFLPTSEVGVHIMSGSGFRVTRVLDQSPVYYPTGYQHKQAVQRQSKIRDKARGRKADIQMMNDPKFAEAVSRLERALFPGTTASSQPRVPAGSPQGGQWASITGKVRSVLTDDLRNAPYKGSCNPMSGHCYVASEALYHAMGGKAAGLKPMYVKHEGSPHWFLKTKDGKIIDPTADQFKTPVPYHEAKGKGFLTKEPSKRARVVLKRSGLAAS